MLTQEKMWAKIWLSASAALVILMIMLGGATRLTDSGLSITEWKPITGIIPPISPQDWQAEFDKYKIHPEFKALNSSISMKEFKFIFWMEFIHRLLGRITALLIILPTLLIWRIKKLSVIHNNMILISCLTIFQGLIGWYMVSSGLKDNPYVSHYRLALHLILAFIIYHLLIISIMSLINGNCKNTLPNNIRNYRSLSIGMLYIQLSLGALVAGLDAGLIYNTFPLMDNNLIPSELLKQNFDLTLFNNPVFVQFLHRWFGIITGVTIIIFGGQLLFLNAKWQKLVGMLLIFAVIVQILTGITTILFHVPIFLALIHQVGTVILLTLVLFSKL